MFQINYQPTVKPSAYIHVTAKGSQRRDDAALLQIGPF
jgi:hypothetical protein